MMEKTKAVLMDELERRRGKTADIFGKRHQRPIKGQNYALVASEIYLKPGMPSETDTVTGLGELCRSGHARLFLLNGTVWYIKT
jgi:hypothetical protein